MSKGIPLAWLVLSLPTLAAAQKPPDACALLSAADAQAALGNPVGPPDRQGGPMSGIWLSVCQYLAKPKIGAVSLSFERYDSADLLKMITEDLGKEAGDEVVAGLGERAVWKDKAEQLKVVVDHDLLTLTLVPAKDVKPRKEQSIDLMKKILARR